MYVTGTYKKLRAENELNFELFAVIIGVRCINIKNERSRVITLPTTGKKVRHTEEYFNFDLFGNVFEY